MFLMFFFLFCLRTIALFDVARPYRHGSVIRAWGYLGAGSFFFPSCFVPLLPRVTQWNLSPPPDALLYLCFYPPLGW